MADLISTTYAQQVVPALANTNPATLTVLISAASRTVQRYCRRNFVPNRYIERYDATELPYLMLRQTPVLGLNSVTLFPDGSNPTIFTPDQFALRPEVGRISIKPEVVATFSAFPWPGYGGFGTTWGAAGFWCGPLNAIQVNYNAGYGFLTQSPSAIPAGATTVTPTLMSRQSIDPDWGNWAVVAGANLLVDAGTSAAETVTVISTTATNFSATFANTHSADCQLIGSLIPDDIQLACALIAGNLVNQPDLTKQRESLGKTVGYEYVIRPGDLLFTPEILAILNRYRDSLV